MLTLNKENSVARLFWLEGKELESLLGVKVKNS
ncbi:hypothetical protein NEOC65_000279 [Neochlamydia sp. AcF65]|nr:hypothetical protein [Neochlamydia sp. AcF65]